MAMIGFVGKETLGLQSIGDAKNCCEKCVPPHESSDYLRIVREGGTEYGIEEAKAQTEEEEDEKRGTNILVTF
jgi:hypothetical protein